MIQELKAGFVIFAYYRTLLSLFSLLQDLSEEQLSQWASGSRSGLSAKLQALRKALYNEYVQEVAALKKQHGAELTRLRQQLERGSEGDGGATSYLETAGVAGQGKLSVEVEVAKVGDRNVSAASLA